MSKHRNIILTDVQRRYLESLVRSGSARARSINRARILLLSDRSQSPYRTAKQVAESLLCSRRTVDAIRKRYLNEGLESALTEKPRPGASVRPKITGEVEAKLIALACSAPPEGKARWTLK